MIDENESVKFHNSNFSSVCHYCGIEFVSKTGNPNMYCSGSCRQRAYYVRNGIRRDNRKTQQCVGVAPILPTFESKLKSVLMVQESTKPISNPKYSEGQLHALQAEVKELKQLLAYSDLKASAFEEMINVAEKMFNVNIRKKRGAKR